MTPSTSDERYMRRCLQLASHGLGRVRPNPMVGCVVVKEGRIVSEGYHRQHGGWHAERNALMNCSPELSEGSTLYVNLEPCSHYGLTPPCADLIVERRVARVVACNDDPNPKVNGRGFRLLEEHGIEVTRHVLEEEGRWLNRRFFTFQEQHRPYVVLKWAESADGFLAPDYQPYWITRPALRTLAHRWRAEEAAILVGRRTFEADRPRLDVRLWQGRNPQPVVMGLAEGVPEHWLALPHMEVREVLSVLYERGLQSVLVEGGRQVLEAFLESGLYDEVRILQGDIRYGTGLPAPDKTKIPAHLLRVYR